MAKKRRIRKIRKQDIKYYAIALVIALILTVITEWGQEDANTLSEGQDSYVSTTEDIESMEGMQVHFLDVGQGLSILVEVDDQVLIYDGGDSDTSSYVVSYLKQQGITEIDYMISSHYDSDHLNGLIGCLKAFDVKNVIGSDYEHDSRLYGSFMDAVEAEGLEMQYPEVGERFALGEAEFVILSPEEIVRDSNANSVAIKLQFGDNSFIFTGDADVDSEENMCASGINLSCDVLSLGHHGSSTSNSSYFLEKTLPEFAVISCGADNSYGHPHVEVVEMLEAMEIDVFRSDVQGTVIAVSDGEKITWSEAPCNDYSDGD